MKIQNFESWKVYAHYLILTLAVFGIHYLTDIWGIEKLVFEGSWGWVVLFLFYSVGILISDTLILLVLGKD